MTIRSGRMPWTHLLLAVASAACTTSNPDASSGTDTDGCQAGQIGCACAMGDTCVAPGLCQEGVCVPPAPGVCGDGNLDLDEECDLGDANSDAGQCKTDCTLQRCGDGAVGPGEACDDGNQIDDDACSNACAPPSCGDGIVQAPETCDDGNDVDTDACLSTCVEATCGDGVVHEGVEECDDQNADDLDGCRADCRLVVDASCSDGMVQPGEFCYEDADTQATATVEPSKVVVADFDGDDDLDAAVLFTSADRVRIYQGDGTGALVAGAQVPIKGNMEATYGASDLAALDYDGDGDMDIVIVAPKADRVVWLDNTGGVPGFEAKLAVTFPAGSSPLVLAEGDFDGDGAQDFAVATTQDTNTPFRLTAVVGGATYEASLDDVFVATMAAADLDGNGTDEVVAFGPLDDVAKIYELAGGALSLAQTVPLVGSKTPWRAAGGDLDGDGLGDVVFTHWTYSACDLSMAGAPCDPGRLVVLHGDDAGLGEVGMFSEVVTGPAPLPIVLGDFTSDGTPDAAVISGTTGHIWVQRENGPAPLELSETLAYNVGNSFFYDLAQGDLNGDGVPDFVSVHADAGTLRVVLSTP